jgi:hypothetical protein
MQMFDAEFGNTFGAELLQTMVQFRRRCPELCKAKDALPLSPTYQTVCNAMDRIRRPRSWKR